MISPQNVDRRNHKGNIATSDSSGRCSSSSRRNNNNSNNNNNNNATIRRQPQEEPLLHKKSAMSTAAATKSSPFFLLCGMNLCFLLIVISLFHNMNTHNMTAMTTTSALTNTKLLQNQQQQHLSLRRQQQQQIYDKQEKDETIEYVTLTSAVGGSKEGEDGWKWYNGNLNEYYNDLEKDVQRNPKDINSYAVHRWLGHKRSTQEHYTLIHNAIHQYHNDDANPDLRVLDAGCGLGAGLTWMEQTEPTWELYGRTISQTQYDFITKQLPSHQFHVDLKSYNDVLPQQPKVNVIYSIEALIHSPNVTETLETWYRHFLDNNNNGGLVIIIDDFISEDYHNDDATDDEDEMELFRQSWLANALTTVSNLAEIAYQVSNGRLRLVHDLDITKEYNVVQLNYRNTVPKIDDKRKHQGWLGGKLRHKLTVLGKITYHMLVFSTTAAAAATTTTSGTVAVQQQQR